MASELKSCLKSVPENTSDKYVHDTLSLAVTFKSGIDYGNGRERATRVKYG